MQRRSDKQLKLHELWDSGERSGLRFSVQWHQRQSLTATNSAAGCQLSIWEQMRRMFVTDHYLTLGSPCEDIKERQYLHKRTEALRSVRNRIKNWCDANSTDSRRMCSVGYSNMGPLRGNYNTRNC